jgi:hypothetical protein
VNRCPSDLQLEVYLLGGAAPVVRVHVETCAQCAQRLAAMRAAGDEFEREVFPATYERVTATPLRLEREPATDPQSPARPWWRWLVVAAPVAAAAAVAVLLLYGPALRRSAIELAVFVDTSGAMERISDGAVVPASAALRFRVQPKTSCNLWVLSVNGEGDIVRLYPPKGNRALEERTLPPAPQDLPSVAELDGRPGPQRIFAVCTQTPVPWNTVKTAAAEKLGTGPDAVRSFRSIPGLPPGATQTTLLVEKRT